MKRLFGLACLALLAVSCGNSGLGNVTKVDMGDVDCYVVIALGGDPKSIDCVPKWQEAAP